jgi:hypothetical protein
MKKITILVLIIGVAIGLTLCHKPDTLREEGQTEISKDINELDVSDNFRWKTIKDVNISLQSSTDAVALIKSVKGDVYLKAFIKAGQKLDTKITIPTYVTEIMLSCKGQEKTMAVETGIIEYDFN